MQLTIDTSEALSTTERKILNLLLGEEEDEKETPQPRKSAAKKTTSKRASKKSEPEPEPDEDDDDDDAGDDEEESLLDQAVAKATELLSEGRQSEVRAALKSVGAKKVSDLKGAKVQKFLDALDEDDD